MSRTVTDEQIARLVEMILGDEPWDPLPIEEDEIEEAGFATATIDVRPHLRRTEHGIIPVVGYQQRRELSDVDAADEAYTRIFGDGDFWDMDDQEILIKQEAYVREAFAAKLPGGYRTEMGRVQASALSENVAAFGHIRGASGNSVGTFLRTVIRRGDTTTVRNSSLDITSERNQGQGIATAINDRAEAFWRRAGFNEVTLNADGTVGAYAWAAGGWDWNLTHSPAAVGIHDIARRMTDRLRRSANDPHALSREERLRAEDYIEAMHAAIDDPTHERMLALPTPKDIASLGRDEIMMVGGREMWWGKAMLLGASWEGRKEL